MSGISVHQAGQSDLELAARDLAVLLCPYEAGNPILPTLEANDGSLEIPDYYISVGNFTKAGGVTLGNNPEIADTESHGKGTPTRQIPSKRPITLGFEPQETKLINLALFWGTDWLTNVPDLSPTAGFAAAIPELPSNLKFRAILLGWDDFNGKDIFIYWICNKVSVSQTSDQELTDSAVIRYPYTLLCQPDGDEQSPLTFGLCGEGWADLQDITDAGFSGS